MSSQKHCARKLSKRLSGNSREEIRRRRKSLFRPLVEALEERQLLATFTVTSNADSGAGTFRQAILNANASPGADLIQFSIGSGTQTIAPLSSLPSITDSVTIDVTTQPGFGSSPIIELRGDSAGTADGLDINANNSIVRGLVVNRFSSHGILLQGNNNTVVGNFIGTDVSGATDLGNGGSGVIITNGDSNTIGGTTASDRNVISGNNAHGVLIINGSDSNVVQGNYIGTTAAGTAALGNSIRGVSIEGGTGNTIGGSTVGARNIIAGSGGQGVVVQESVNGASSGNIIRGNYIGTDAAGDADLGNNQEGVVINDVANTQIIGNTISGNNGHGINILGATSIGNVVQGNIIGLNAAGNAVVGNGNRGVAITDGSNNTIGGTTAAERNVISGNFVGVDITGAAGGNFVTGNYIGTNLLGTGALGNTTLGIRVSNSPNNTIGGPTAGHRNVISGNGTSGVSIEGVAATGNIIQSNYIGTNAAGNAALGNGSAGVTLNRAMSNAVLGNVISGNTGYGIVVTTTNQPGTAANNSIRGNLIGLNSTFAAPLPNAGGIKIDGASNTTIGGSVVGDPNVIAGNNSHAVWITGSAAMGTQVLGNIIGTNLEGSPDLGNSGNGVFIENGASNSMIGGTVPGSGNLITDGTGGGVIISSGTGNAVLGNSIFGNDNLGIGLGTDAVTPNDAGDGDAGANNLQNFPVITSAVSNGTNTTIQGTFNSAASSTFRLEFFKQVLADPSGFGEGKTFLGFVNVTTDAVGNATFSNAFSTILQGHEFVTATATDSANNTSEFSAAFQITALVPTGSISPILATDLTLNAAATGAGRANVAFDGNRYLTVWAEGGNILGRLYNAAGVASGGAFTISSSPTLETAPAVAFNGTHYFVTWADNTAGGDIILGRSVSTSGTLGGPVTFGSGSNGRSNPAVASDGSGFLVVWEDLVNFATTGSDILGQRISVDGAGNASLVGSTMAVAQIAGDQNFPSVAFGGGTYFVAWQSNISGAVDVYGALVSPSGTISSPIAVSTATGLQLGPQVAYGGSTFLVAFGDTRLASSNVFAARVTTGGTLVDGPASSGGILIATGSGPAVAFNGSEWLIAFDTGLIKAARLSLDGVVESPAVTISQTASNNQSAIAPGSGGRYFVTWSKSDNSNKQAQLVAPVGAWDGGAGTLNWTDALNWQNDFLPNANTHVTIGDLLGTPTITVNGTVSINTLTSAEKISFTGGTFSIAGAAAFNAGLAVSGGTMNVSSNSSSTFVNLTGGTMKVLTGATFTLTGAGSTWTGGQVGATGSDGGLVRNTGTLTVNVAGGVNVLQSTRLSNAGTVIHLDGTVNSGGGLITNEVGGVWDVQSNTGGLTANGGATAGVVNFGTIQRTAGTGAFSLGASVVGTPTFRNAGLLDIQTGSVTITGADATTSTGEYRIASGRTLILSNGAHVYGAGASFTGAGTVRFDGASPGFTFNANVPANNVHLNGGTINVAAGNTFTWSGANSSWSTGVIAGSGQVTNTGSIALTGGTISGTFNNQGTIAWTSGSVAGSGTFVNQAGGSVTDQTTVATTFSAAFDNQASATFTHSGAGTNTFSGIFTNSGTVNVTAGKVSLDASGTHTHAGSFAGSGSGIIEFGRGTHTLTAASSVTTPNVRFFNAGTVNINGTYNVSGSTTGSDNSNTVTFNSSANVQSVGSTLSIGTFGTYTFSSGEPIDVATFTINGGTLLGSDNLTITSAGSNWAAGTIGGAGTINVSASGSINLTGTGTKTLNRAFDNLGTVTWLGTQPIAGSGTITNRPGGTFNAQVAQAINPAFINRLGATLNINAASTTLAGAFTNEGTVNVDGGGLIINGGGTHTGTFDVDASRTLTFGAGTHNINAGSVVGAGTVRGDTATVNLNGGTYNVTGGTHHIGAGAMNFLAGVNVVSVGGLSISSGTLNFSSGEAISAATLAQTSGFLSGTDVVTVSGGTTWSGGSMTGAGTTTFNGTTTISGSGRGLSGGRTLGGSGATNLAVNASFNIGAGGATLNFVPGAFQMLAGSGFATGANTLTNAGSISVNSSLANPIVFDGKLTNTGSMIQSIGQVRLVTATINNQATGVYEFSGNVGFDSFSGVHQINNAGTFRKSAGTGLSSFPTVADFNNQGGTVDVQTGTLTLSRGTSTGGTYTVASGTTLNLTGGGSQTYTGTHTGSGAGTINLDGGGSNTGAIVAGAGGATLNFLANLFRWKNGATITATAGNLTNAGRITIDAGAGIGFAMLGGTLNNTGTINHSAGNLRLSSATINNQAGGVFDMADVGFTNFSGTHTINNAGELRKSTGIGIATVIGTLNNTGSVRAEAGTLSITNSITQYSGSTLTGGQWFVTNATLAFPVSGANIATLGSGAGVSLSGATSTFAKLNTLTNNQGTFRLENGRTFITTADFANSGTIEVDATSKLQTGLTGQVSLWSGEGSASDSVDGNNGTLQSGATATASGRLGQTFSFDGTTNAIVDLPGTSSGNLAITGNQLTIEGWVFQTDGTQTGNLSGSQFIFWKHDGTAAGYQFQTFNNGFLGTNIATTSNGTFGLGAPATLPLNTWVHAAVTYDGSTVRLYQNGAQVASAPLTGNIIHSAINASIGNATTDHGYGFKGRIDELSVYNRALSASEISAIASANRVTQSGGTTDLGVGGTLHGGIRLTGGTLEGTGTVRGDVENGATVAPGNSPGIITINGNYSQDAGATLEIEIAGTDPLVPEFDQLFVNGIVTLDGSLDVVLLGGFVPTSGDTFKIIDNDGADAVIGTFAGLPEGSSVFAGGTRFQVSYIGGTGNDVVLTAGLTVTTTADSGPGSLRQAILDANAFVGVESIAFNIPAAGPHTINILSPLPFVTDPLIIDGWTQIGFTAAPLIVLDGTSAGASHGLVVDTPAAGSVIRGLVITNFQATPGGGIVTHADNVKIQGNYLGTNAAGTAAAAIQTTYGIVAADGDNTIIGTDGDGVNDALEGNLISGTLVGIILQNDADNLVIAGNKIGTNAAGDAAIGNDLRGIYISEAAQNNTRIGTNGNGTSDAFERNIISASGTGILDNGTGTIVAGNYIGTNADGTAALAGSGVGISVEGGATGTRIGTNGDGNGDAAERNLISGNSLVGIAIGGPTTTGVVVAGNYIGTNADGSAAIANESGIQITAGAAGNTIGTNGDGLNDASEGNVISGNSQYGIIIDGANGNRVAGNNIGTNAAGTGAIPNFDGVAIFSSTGNFIGTDSSIDAFNANERNLISGNSDRGVLLDGANVVAGNWIGLKADGTALGNQFGIQVTGEGSRVGTNANGQADTEERNVISGNTLAGIIIRNATTSEATVAGNYIGTDPTGALARPNATGIDIVFDAHNNTIGGATPAKRNVISGNSNSGIKISDDATEISILGNYIGTDASGTIALGNTQAGVTLDNVSSNTIGGTNAGEGNVISGNVSSGIHIFSGGDNVIAGNLIGVNAAGLAALGNLNGGIRLESSNNNVIGGTTAGARNVISGNQSWGIHINDPLTAGNVVQGNYIGLNVAGTAALGNVGNGIMLVAGASDNTIGGAVPGAGNVISGNTQSGLLIFVDDITIQGNFIGTDASGTADLGNSVNGINVFANVTGIEIGGTVAGAGNVISGNNAHGISGGGGLTIQGNIIGLDKNGNADLGNSLKGIVLGNGSGTLIGGDDADDGALDGVVKARNIISGNNQSGISFVSGNGVAGHAVRGNYIGTDITGTLPRGNSESGVAIENGTNITVGGTTAGAGNVISANALHGIFVTNLSENALIQGNLIGLTAAGNADLGNAGNGINITGDGVTVGGTSAAARNVISGNTLDGISISGPVNPASIVSWWKADGDANDSIGGNHGTPVGGAGFATGLVGGSAFSFDGSSGYVEVPDAASLTPASLSLDAWVNPDTLSVPAGFGGRVILGKYDSSDTVNQGLSWVIELLEGGHIEFDVFGTTSGSSYLSAITTAPVLAAGRWQHVAATFDAATQEIRVYVNGAEVAVNVTGAGTVTAIANSGTPVTIGAITGGNGLKTNFWDGLIDEPAVWNRALSAAEIQNIHLAAGTAKSSNTIQGNYIGLNAAGDAAIGNSRDGVRIANSPGNIIGGLAAVPGAGPGNVISGNALHGILMFGDNSNGNLVRGSIIGLDAAGSADLGNGAGIVIGGGFSDFNTIGGGAAGARNIISGNNGSGITIVGGNQPPGSNNFIAGNYIGTDITGNLDRGNDESGINIGNGPFGTIVGTNADGINDATEGNLISGNNDRGVRIETSNTKVSGNRIGTNAAGTAALPNSAVGVDIAGFQNNIIGGTTAVERNLISGNPVGVEISSLGNNNYLWGNFIGADITGASAIPNTVGVSLGGTGGTVGGSFAGAGNVISGNLTGIRIQSGDGNNHTIIGNLIGTDAAGTGPLGNNVGIQISSTNPGNGHDNRVGGLLPGEANTIAFNQGPGIVLQNNAANVNTIRGNSFSNNIGLAIDIGTPGITLNEPGDADGVLNYPVITSAEIVGQNLVITGFARPGTTFDLYLAALDGTKFGEGRQYLATLTEGSGLDQSGTTNSYGPNHPSANFPGLAIGSDTTNAFGFALPLASLPAGVEFSAALTAHTVGSTSEFSPVFIIGDAPANLAPVIILGGNATLSAGETLQREASFTDVDSSSWTATVNYGDGLGFQPLVLNLDKTFTLNHVYANPGSYTVTVNILDNSASLGSSSFSVSVTNSTPVLTDNELALSPAIVNENGIVTLHGSYTDLGPNDTHTLRVRWGDGTETTVPAANINTANRTFEATHQYLDDNISGSAFDIYPIQVVVVDSAGAFDESTYGLVFAQVNNIRPTNLVLTPSSMSLIENGILTLSGSFTDPGTLDTHRVVIDWGDGSPRTTVNLPAGVTSFSGLPELQHRYLDDPAQGPDQYVVIVELTDKDEPLLPLTAQQLVTVANASPSSVTLSLSASTIDENGEIELSGSFLDPGSLDTHRATIDWGDGTLASPSITTLDLPAGIFSFAGVRHKYRDDAAGNFDVYNISVKVADDDGGMSAASVASVVLQNVAPILTNIELHENGNASDGVINEGDTVTITGSYTDVGPADRHTVLVTWDDGSTSLASIDSTSRTFTATHTYRDDKPGALNLNTISVVVTDDDGASSNPLTQNLIVNNVAPEVQVVPGPGSSITEVVLTAKVTDPGLADTHVFSWLVAGETTPRTGQTITVTRPTGNAAPIRVTLTATDDDGDSDQDTLDVIALDDGANTYVANPLDEPAPGAVEYVVVLGLGGEDVINFSAWSTPVILDGGADNDILTGGFGNDTIILHQGDDQGFGGGGNDNFVATFNSTISVTDFEGFNSLDFSPTPFGVTFDLDLAVSSLVDVQEVAAGHFADIEGTFVSLTGTSSIDRLTAASQSTLFGGGGADLLYAKPGTTNVRFFGGADADVLTAGAIGDSTGISGIDFSGDDGADTFIVVEGTTIGGNIEFHGGADADVFENLGTLGSSVTDAISFEGDDGADVFVNHDLGAIVGEITFSGGADVDAFTNFGDLTAIDFSGDDGADIFINEAGGVITGLIEFHGGADVDVFTNLGTLGDGATDVISFEGDDGADIFVNEIGATVLGSIVFHGGADADVFENEGSLGSATDFGSISFEGDDGADTFINQDFASIFGDIVFAGGADADVFENDGTVGSVDFFGNGPIDFGGDDGADTFINTAGGVVLGDIFFAGDDGADVLKNLGSLGDSVIDSISFEGDDGADVFINGQGAEILGGITFAGGADADVFVNQGSLGSSLEESPISFEGDDGADVFVNDLTGIIWEGIVFSGGADADVFENLGTLGDSITDAISFEGDDGADLFINHESGVVSGAITFEGGADADVLVNDGTLGSVDFFGNTAIDFSGDDGADTFVNTAEGDIFGAITFSGDDGADVFENLGTLGDSVTDTISFEGDDGADVFVNQEGGTIFSSITFEGDDGADVFLNEGTIGGTFETTTISFEGDDGADVFISEAGGVISGGIIFMGGADEDALVNFTDLVGSIDFRGDDGADLLVNFGDQLGSITFEGGADDGADIFQNLGNEIFSISFDGDDGADIFINEGDFITTISFEGDDGADTFTNLGDSFGSIEFVDTSIDFAGDTNALSGNDVFINRGSGQKGPSAASTITFRGGPGNDAFQNNGLHLLSLAFFGDDGADVFQNNASELTSISFEGDDGADTFENNGESVSNITFSNIDLSGGADVDVFINDGNFVSGIDFQGDDGADLFLNTGDLVSAIDFGGDDGADLFINFGAQLTQIEFDGDDGADTFLNFGQEMSQITFEGGADGDLLRNMPSAVGSHHIAFFGFSATGPGMGDDGADVFVNEASNVSFITFEGGADVDVLQNNGSQVTEIDFSGDDGADVLINKGENVTEIDFSGDEGADIFVNSGDFVIGIHFNGDDGADTLINDGNFTGGIVFSGGADIDALINNGTDAVGIDFSGDSGDDRFQNNGLRASGLVFQGDDGADAFENNANDVVSIDFSGDDGVDFLVNNGDFVGSIDFSGGADQDRLSNHGDSVAMITFAGGADADVLINYGHDIVAIDFSGDSGFDAFINHGSVAGIVAHGGNEDDAFILGGSAGQAAFHGDFGDDRFIILGDASLSLTGGDGSDHYVFEGTTSAQAEIVELATGTGRDKIDFSAFALANSTDGINLDLARTDQQSVISGLAVRFSDALGMEDVIATAGEDTVYGNAKDNRIVGGDFAARRTPTPPPAGWVAPGRRQWVLLDFASKTDPGEHVYTQEERDAIQANVQYDYTGPDALNPWFNVVIAQNVNDIPAEVGSDYVTMYFNETPSFGRPGGEASELDFRNLSLAATGFVQVNGLLGGFDYPPVGEWDNLSTPSENVGLAGTPKAPVGTSDNFVALASKIAAHELAHTLGLRHADAQGPISFGLHNPPGGQDYGPAFTGPAAAFESFDHLIGSPASIGSSRFNDLNDLFFGERETIKLSFNERGVVLDQSQAAAGSHSNLATAHPIALYDLSVPNTLSHGINAGKSLLVGAVDVVGSIGLVDGHSESDWYSFSGLAGDVINIDVMSTGLSRLKGHTQTIDSVVRVHDEQGVLLNYYGSSATNDDQFEPTDSALVDLVLPADGTYYIEVDTFARAAGDPLNGQILQPAEGSVFDETLDNGQPNPHFIGAERYAIARDGAADTDTGIYELFIYRMEAVSPFDGQDNLQGREGVDVIDGGTEETYELVIADQADELGRQEGDTLLRTVVFEDRGGSSWTASVDYGDGTVEQHILSEQSLNLDHIYRDNGIVPVVITVTNDDGASDTATFNVYLNNVNPTAVISDGTTILESGSATISLSQPLDPSAEDTEAGLRYSFALSISGLANTVRRRNSGDESVVRI